MENFMTANGHIWGVPISIFSKQRMKQHPKLQKILHFYPLTLWSGRRFASITVPLSFFFLEKTRSFGAETPLEDWERDPAMSQEISIHNICVCVCVWGCVCVGVCKV